MPFSLTPTDRAILRWDGRRFSAFVVLDGKHEAYTHGSVGASESEALTQAYTAADLLRQQGVCNRPELPSVAEFTELMEAEREC